MKHAKNWLIILLMEPLMFSVYGQHDIQPCGPVVTVKPIGNVPTFVVNDHPFTIPCFETYAPEERYFRQFAEQGVKLFSFNTNVLACDYNHSRPVSPLLGVWDYAEFDARFERVLNAAPDALVIPRINMGTPVWWLEQNPEELEVLDDGGTIYIEPNRNPTVPKGRPFPSIASHKWREDSAEALLRLVNHLNETGACEHLFGFMLAGLDTEEWYQWSAGSGQLLGYSQPTLRAFQDWLKEKYGDERTLQTAWGNPELTFSSVTVPSRLERMDESLKSLRDPSTDMPVIDFYLFYSDLVVDTIDYFASVLREATGGQKAIGAFYGYMYEYGGDPEFGHNALAQYNRSPNLDFIFVTASYEDRAFGSGSEYARSPAMSVRLHGKLWYHDNDVISFLAPEVMQRIGLKDGGAWSQSQEHHLRVLGYTSIAEQTQWMYRRSLGFALCNGAFESFFDLHGGYYDHPELMAEVGRLCRIADQSAQVDRSSISEVLIVSDEESCAYATFRSQLLVQSLQNVQPQLTKAGFPTDHILACDLDLIDPTPYKLVVFLNCWNMNEQTRQTIEQRYKRDGRWLVWCYAPGFFDGHRSSEAWMEKLTGIPIKTPRENGDSCLLSPRIVLNATGASVLGLMEGTVIGADIPSIENFYVDEGAAQSLGVLETTGKSVMALSQQGEYVSLYLLTPSMPSAAWRGLAQSAGVHIWNRQDDTFYANRSYICIHANGDGLREIRLPMDTCSVLDVVESYSMEVVKGAVRMDMRHGETRILRLLPPE